MRLPWLLAPLGMGNCSDLITSAARLDYLADLD